MVRIGRRLEHSSSLASGKARKAAVIFYQVGLWKAKKGSCDILPGWPVVRLGRQL